MSKLALSRYFGYWLLQQLVLLYTVWCGLNPVYTRLGHIVSAVGNANVIIVYIRLLLWCVLMCIFRCCCRLLCYEFAVFVAWFTEHTIYNWILCSSRIICCHLLFLFWRCWITVRRQCRWHCRGELQHLLPNPNALVAVSKGIRAVKLCTNKILQFLTLGAGCRLTYLMAIKRVVVEDLFEDLL